MRVYDIVTLDLRRERGNMGEEPVFVSEGRTAIMGLENAVETITLTPDFSPRSAGGIAREFAGITQAKIVAVKKDTKTETVSFDAVILG